MQAVNYDQEYLPLCKGSRVLPAHGPPGSSRLSLPESSLRRYNVTSVDDDMVQEDAKALLGFNTIVSRTMLRET